MGVHENKVPNNFNKVPISLNYSALCFYNLPCYFYNGHHKDLRSHSCKEHCANAGLFVYVNGGLFGLKFVLLRQRLPTFAIRIISVGYDNE